MMETKCEKSEVKYHGSVAISIPYGTCCMSKLSDQDLEDCKCSNVRGSKTMGRSSMVSSKMVHPGNMHTLVSVL